MRTTPGLRHDFLHVFLASAWPHPTRRQDASACRAPRAGYFGLRAYVKVAKAGSRRGYRNPVSVLGLVLFVEILATETSAGRGKTTFTSLPYHERATTPAIARAIRPAP